MDFCCLQETGWKGEGARKLGEYKFFWMGCSRGIHGAYAEIKFSTVLPTITLSTISLSLTRLTSSTFSIHLSATSRQFYPMNSPRAAHPENLYSPNFGAVQLLCNALGGGGGHGVTLCDRVEKGGSAERHVMPKIIYIYV